MRQPRFPGSGTEHYGFLLGLLASSIILFALVAAYVRPWWVAFIALGVPVAVVFWGRALLGRW